MQMQGNPFAQQLMTMMSQGGGNPQAYVQQLLQQNPQFARQIQGQNVQQMAAQALQRMGINPQAFFQNPQQFLGMMMNGRR
jgi:ABC-type dipeptide/oligopeptide/nickel transport system ATPase subunit